MVGKRGGSSHWRRAYYSALSLCCTRLLFELVRPWLAGNLDYPDVSLWHFAASMSQRRPIAAFWRSIAASNCMHALLVRQPVTTNRHKMAKLTFFQAAFE